MGCLRGTAVFSVTLLISSKAVMAHFYRRSVTFLLGVVYYAIVEFLPDEA